MGVSPAAGVSASGKSPYEKDQANGVDQGILAAVGPGKPFAFYGTVNLFVWVEFATTLTTADNDLSVTVAAAGTIAAGASINSVLLPPGTTVGSIVGTGAEVVLPIRTFDGTTVANVAQIAEIFDTDWLLGSTVAGYGLAGTETVTSIVVPSRAPDGTAGYPGQRGTIELSAAPTSVPTNKNPREPYEFALAPTPIVTGAEAAIFTGAAIVMTGTIQLERSFDGGNTWLVCNVGGGGQLAQWSLANGPISVSFGEPEKGILYRLNVAALTPSAGYSLHYRLSATGQAATTLSVQTL